MNIKLDMDTLLRNQANTKFYEWESDIYGQHTTLSDDDRLLWVEGYLYGRSMK